MHLCVLFLLSLIGFGQQCNPDQITVSSPETRGAGMGHNYRRAVIRNDSKLACYLEGVPQVVVLDGSGKIIPSKTEGHVEVNMCGEGSTRYLLKPGASAAVWTDTASSNFDENFCGTRLRMTVNGKSGTVHTVACGRKGKAVEVFLSGFVDPNTCGGK